MDHRLEIIGDRDIKILQITDMQVIDSSQQRTPDRLCEAEYIKWLPEKKEENIYSHIRYLVQKTSPDLIIITGDIIYGEFDDSGETFAEFCEFMDSFGIPWAPVYGNHDNESKMGIDRQCELFASAKYSFFSRGSVFGNSNYSVGIFRNGELIRTVFMMDSNGCGKLGIPQGFAPDQLEWMKKEAAKCGDVPTFMCFHIPTSDFPDAVLAAGYQPAADKSSSEFYSYEIGVDIPAKEGSGDFGKKTEGYGSCVNSILDHLKECRTDGVFVGHYHRNSTSVMYEGIRFTFGLKTGLYDYHDPEAVGGTLITLSGTDFSVEHVRYPIKEA